jgi:hypothetical protein
VEQIAKPAEQARALPAFCLLPEPPEKGEASCGLVIAPLDNRLTAEETMYATIRRYVPKTPNTKEAIEDLKHRIEDGFLPIVQEVPGFHSYGAVNVGNREVVTISIFEDRTGTSESNRRAAEFVQKDPLKDQLGKPEVLEGELMVLKEAGVGVR